MKKLLAMVLALVMTLSLAVSANAFKDDTKISDDYAEAVAVLNGMGVFKGYEDGSFKPEGNITRAEVATIVYRIYTADVAKNDKSGLYATYNKFSDMAGASWAAGYIGYCANASLVKGYPDGTFKPSGKVTGYEVLAMILRAVGYDKNNEFSGADWALHVAQTAQQLGVLDNVAKTTDLNAPASRELVAELLFQGIQKAQVTYTPAFGYVTDKVTGKANSSLGTKNFDLKSAKAADKWGRPATKWTYTTGDNSTLVVAKADVSYTTAVAECDVAKDLGLNADKTFKLVVNGANESNIIIQRLDTVEKVGAQGRLVEVYKDAGVVVMIDTFLAKVTDNVEAKFDKNGHQTAPYQLHLDVYDQNGGAASTVVLEDVDNAYTYAEGDYILINAYTNGGNRNTAQTGLVATDRTSHVANYAEIVGKAESIDGTQTVIWSTNDKHTVNGTTYDDAVEFNHNEAANNITNYTWYFDQYGNLIGAFAVATKYDYAVLTEIWCNVTNGDYTVMGTLKYMDGTENTVEVSSIDGAATAYVGYNNADNQTMKKISVGPDAYKFFVAAPKATNAAADGNDWIKGHLLRVETKSDNSVKLTKVVDANGTYTTTGAHAQVRDYVYNKGAYIGGVRVDTATLFLTYDASSKTFNTYNGINEVPSYSTGRSPVVDYVLGSNGVAKYIYIVGTPDSAVTKDYVLLTTASYSATLKTDTDGIDYYEVNLNTVEGSVSIKTRDVDVKNTLVNSANLNKLYYVTYSDGFAVALREVTGTAYAVDAANSIYDVKANDGTVATTYENGVIENSTGRYNVTDATVKVGTLTKNLSDKIVYVIYKQSGEYNNIKVAEKVYVVDAAASAPNEPTQYSYVTYNVTVIDTKNGNATTTYELGTYKVAANQQASNYQWSQCWGLMDNHDTNWTRNDATYAVLTALGVNGSESAATINVNTTVGNSGSYTFIIAK